MPKSFDKYFTFGLGAFRCVEIDLLFLRWWRWLV
jgi:hypothetical protein